MKANELMIGDWVQYPATMGNLVPCKVVGISTEITVEFTTGARKYEALKVAQPIPLTSEILEKNEFRNSLDEWHLFKGCLQTNFTLKSYDDTNEVLLPLFNGNMQIIYVHELQHALRLCGIEKEIIL